MKVVILAGGLGTRIAEETSTRPKPMVEIGGRPILWHIMKLYSHYGFRKFILCLGYKSDMVKQHFLDYRLHAADFTLALASEDGPTFHNAGETEDWEITFVETGLLTGTGGRVKRVADHIDTDTFLLTYGDGIGSVDIDGLVKQHLASGLLGTVTGVHPASRYGEMHIDGQVVTEFNEKPTLATGWVSGGFFAFNKLMIDKYLDDDADLLLEKKPLQTLAADRELGIFHHEGFWMGMDTYRDWTELNQLWDAGQAAWKVWED